MSAEARRKKRELRKVIRKERKEAFAKFIEAIEAFKDIDLKEKLPFKEKFKQVWPAIKPTLEFAIILKITGEKFDAPAQKVIILGEKLKGGQISDQEAIDFLAMLQEIWETVESVLEILKIVVPDKTDAVIDKVIDIGDWLFE